MSIKVITQNVMCWSTDYNSHKERRPLLKRVFTDYGADLLGLQEVTPKWNDYFVEDLRDFDSIFKYRGENDREAAPLYWKRDKFVKLDGGYFWLSDTPDKESVGWGAACSRITTWVHLREKKTGKEFAFVNTHLDHTSESARINGIKLIKSFIAGKFGENMPIILTGDFNSTPDSATIKTAKEMLNDTRDVADISSDELTHTEFGRIPPNTIDYIFVTDNISCRRMEVIKEISGKTEQSDHYGVLAELEL